MVAEGAEGGCTLTPEKKAGPLTYALLGLLVLFGLGDYFAETHSDGKNGVYGETVSTFIHHLEYHRWWVRALVGLISLDFASHLTFGTNLLIF
jgi:hypothetical protein